MKFSIGATVKRNYPTNSHAPIGVIEEIGSTNDIDPAAVGVRWTGFEHLNWYVIEDLIEIEDPNNVLKDMLCI